MSTIKLFLFSLVMISARPALACDTLVKWKIDEKPVETCYDKKAKGYLSKSCLKDACGARAILKRAGEVSLQSKIAVKVLPVNPGEVICIELGGKIRLAKLESGSEGGFCEANDGTVVDYNSLARAHDRKK